MIVLAVLCAAIAVGAAGLVKAGLYRAGPPAPRVVNHRGIEIPAVGGLVIMGTFVAFEAILGLLASFEPTAPGVGSSFSPFSIRQTFYSFEHLGLAIIILGYFSLGTIDDYAEAGSGKGLAGHARALREGRLTTGALKAVGGLALGWVFGAVLERTLLEAFVAGLVVALSANLINLLDLAPGRAVKAFLLWWAPLAVATSASPFLPLSLVIGGSAAVWLPTDLSEKGMLGDAGANLLGGVAGAGIVVAFSMPGQLVALAILLGLTLASERVSFSRVIGRTPGLRELDRLGRPRE